MFTNIAIYIDPSVNSQPMLNCIIPLALVTKARITLVGVVKPLPPLARMAISSAFLEDINKDMIKNTQQSLDKIASTLEVFALEIKTMVASGETFIELIRQVLKCKFDLLAIMAAKKQLGLPTSFFGSTQMHLLRQCPCPLWIVNPHTTADIKNILTPVDAASEESSEISLNTSLIEASKLVESISHATVHFLQVWSVYAEGYLSVRGGLSEQSIEDMRKDTLESCKQALLSYTELQDWSKSTMHMDLILSNFPSSEIINTVKQKQIDLLIMGTVCRTGIAGFFIGNTAEKVFTEVSCSVLAFKPNDFLTPVTLLKE
ncbi:universal stress protein [uncultured Paraglaciecola sp.]|uniref:universal stress protein n=1 Tax=uncultured Paraglaciecola sp. TaxID=1765024 RepID=UPI0030D9F946|tara:strand:+ start:130947 stop:131897 length:951 start_codon:yes stop_codon:yes gene_type:complete